MKIPSDPWFLLGNYRFALFAHASGMYQIITGERAFGRMNMGDLPNTGKNFAQIEVIGNNAKKIKLTGEDGIGTDPSLCSRTFGCGFAEYQYQTDSLAVIRTISVLPSEKINKGISAFLLTVKIRNTGKETIKTKYIEGVGARYEMIENQHKNGKDKKVIYHHQCVPVGKDLLKVDISGSTEDALLLPPSGQSSPIDGYPPSLFLQSLSDSPNINLEYDSFGDKGAELWSIADLILEPNEEISFQLAIGYCFNPDDGIIREMGNTLKNEYVPGQSPFVKQWRKALPDFGKEKDREIANEMTWHAHTLEALATYNEFYGETKIHQGTSYVFDWGVLASARDDFQHALPLCYYNPELAKSTLRYMRKRTTPWGEIRLIETGYGQAVAWDFNTSDQQLFYFLLLTEYLRITEDFGFLLEKAECYPVTNMPQYNGIDTIEQCFSFLKNTVGLGAHGLVRLLNSDWNDAVYFEIKEPYMSVAGSGESHMNTTMALSTFSRLLPLLERIRQDERFTLSQKRLSDLHQSITLYRNNLLAAFEKDLSTRSFTRRMYFGGKPFGDDNMFLEPQGYMLQIPEISTEKKLQLYEEMKRRVYLGEKLGAREQQTPEFNGQPKGGRENGGFWYALNGPVIVGMASVDKEEANRLLRKMSFSNYSKQFPNYWTSYWSAADNVDSSLLDSEGLTDRSGNYWEQPVYCTHPHAWLLYCYYYLKGNNS